MLFDVGLARSVYSMQVRPGVASSRAVSDATQTLAKPRLRFSAGVKTRPTLLTPSCATVTAAIETTAPSTSQTNNSPAAIIRGVAARRACGTVSGCLGAYRRGRARRGISWVPARNNSLRVIPLCEGDLVLGRSLCGVSD